MAAIFNQGVYHGFEVNSAGALIERWGNPPVNYANPGGADGFKPNTHVSVGRIVHDPKNPFYNAYFVSGLSASGDDVIVWIWDGSKWVGGYGG